MPEKVSPARERSHLSLRTGKDHRCNDPAVQKLRDVVDSAPKGAAPSEAWADSIRGAIKILPANLVSRHADRSAR